MMQVIRDKAQGVVAWVIVAMIAFVFCFWGVSSYLAPSGNQALAEVNGHKITPFEVENIYQRWLREVATQKGFDIKLVDPAFIKQQIVQSLVQQYAVVESLKRDGFAVSDAMVLDNIRSNPQLQQDGKFSIELYKAALAQEGIAESEFEAAQREQLLVGQAQAAIIRSNFATKKESERLIQLQNQKRDFGYTVIPVSKYISSAKISDTEISDYYEKHKAEFVLPEKIQLEYIELSMDDLMKNLPISEQNLQDYYQTNLQSFSEPQLFHLRHIMIDAPKGSDADRSGEAHEKIEDIYKQLELGANFVSLAKKDSEDKQSAVNGGDLGWAAKNDSYPPEVFELKQDGAYTKPVQSDYGWHVFQLVAVKGGGVKSFASVKDAVLARYKRDEAERLFSKKGDELANLTFENPASLTAASEKLNLPITSTDYFTKTGGKGIAASQNVLNAAFSDDVLEQKHNSELIRLSDDSYVVIRLKDKQPEQQQSLEQVHAEIAKNLQLAAARAQASREGDKLLEDIKLGNSPNKATASMNLKWNVVQQAERDTKSVDAALLQRAFVIPKPEKGQAFSSAGFSLPNGDYAVLALSKVTDGKVTHEEDSNMLDSVGKHIAIEEGRFEYNSFQNALIEQAKIKYLKQ
jgi:peptidyl-prolyl cis-trans isomerase D